MTRNIRITLLFAIVHAMFLSGTFWWLRPYLLERPRDLDMAKEIGGIVLVTTLVATWYFNRFFLKKRDGS